MVVFNHIYLVDFVAIRVHEHWLPSYIYFGFTQYSDVVLDHFKPTVDLHLYLKVLISKNDMS